MTELSWSVTRSGLFSTCRRKYWYRYYGQENGWRGSAAAPAQRIYKLSGLDDLSTWRGHLVHNALGDALRTMVSDRNAAAPPLSEVLAQLRRTIVEQWERSTAGDWERASRRDPLFFGLVEHVNMIPGYREGVHADYVFADAAKVIADIWRSTTWRDIVDSARDTWKIIDEPGWFLLDNVKIWCAPDFAFAPAADQHVIVDWKSGELNAERNQLQATAYAAYMHMTHGWPLDSMRAVFTNGAQTWGYTFTVEQLRVFAQRARDELAEMRTLHESRNDRTQFPVVTNTETCRLCPYRTHCR